MFRRWSVAAGLLGAVAFGLLLTPDTGYGQRGRVGGGGVYFGGGPYLGYSPGFYGYAPYRAYGPWYGSWSSYGSYYPSYRFGWSGYPSYYGYDYGANAPYASFRYSDYPNTYFDPRMQTGGEYDYGASAGDPNAVHLNVRVPSNAEVWIEGQKTNQTGRSRFYVSPPLTPRKSYTYEIKARWMENGQEMDQTRTLTVRAGDRQTVDFSDYGAAPQDTEAAEQAPPATRVPREPVDRTPTAERSAPFERAQPPDRSNPPDRTQRVTTPERTTPGERAGTPGRITPPERGTLPGTVPPERRPAPAPDRNNPPPDRNNPPPDRNNPPPPPPPDRP
jgi:uncharacterized protein (TIGR03000 family)